MVGRCQPCMGFGQDLFQELEWMLKTGKAGELRWLPPHLIIVPTLNPQDMLEFPAQELRKYFKMGDHVKVIAGRFEGDTGLIVRVEENFVILFSDLTMHEVGGRVGVWRNCPEVTLAGEPPGPCFTLSSPGS